MVYVLIGVARKGYRPFDTQQQLLEVSYKEPVEVVFGQIAKAILLSSRNLSHLA